MSLHDELVGVLDHQAFFIAVLVFPDMEPDQDIIAKAKRSSKVHVLWGVDGLMDRLTQIAAARGGIQPARRRGHRIGGGCRHRRRGPL